MQMIDTNSDVITAVHRVSSRMSAALQACPGMDGSIHLKQVQRAVSNLLPMPGASFGKVRCDVGQINDVVASMEAGLGVLQSRSALSSVDLQQLMGDWDRLRIFLVNGPARYAAA